MDYLVIDYLPTLLVRELEAEIFDVKLDADSSRVSPESWLFQVRGGPLPLECFATVGVTLNDRPAWEGAGVMDRP